MQVTVDIAIRICIRVGIRVGIHIDVHVDVGVHVEALVDPAERAQTDEHASDEQAGEVGGEHGAHSQWKDRAASKTPTNSAFTIGPPISEHFRRGNTHQAMKNSPRNLGDRCTTHDRGTTPGQGGPIRMLRLIFS